MVFQLTTRTLGFAEIADDPELSRHVANLYWMADKGSTPLSILMPWFPSKARKMRVAASTEMFMICKGLYEERLKKGKTVDDAVQALVDEGISFQMIAEVHKLHFLCSFSNI